MDAPELDCQARRAWLDPDVIVPSNATGLVWAWFTAASDVSPNIRFDDGWGKKAMKTLTYFLPLKRVAEFFPF